MIYCGDKLVRVVILAGRPTCLGCGKPVKAVLG